MGSVGIIIVPYPTQAIDIAYK